MLSLFDLIVLPQSLPFSVALAIVLGFLLIELCAALLGSGILGLGGNGPDIDTDMDFDLSADLDADVSFDFDSLEIDGPEANIDGPSASFGFLNWIGARDVPFLIWLVSF